MVQTINFEVRRAGLADVDEIAAAHLDSIRSIGPRYYDAAIVSHWGAQVKGDLYVNAMARGEVFWIAIGELGDRPAVLGFSSHRIDENDHGVAVYVRGKPARHGIGSALLRSAEAAAIAAGATSIHLDASLAAVEFYKANGFDEVGRGEHRLWSGLPMACVFMRKNLALTRRSFVVGATLGSASLFVRSLRAADHAFTQFHNQPSTSSLHQRLVEMWAAIRTETRGRVETQVFPENNHVQGSDPVALNMLVAGEIQFFTLMGGILGRVVPAAEVQQVPFAFRSAAHALRTMDGELGAYLRKEIAAKGLFAFPVAAFDNGMRQIAGSKRPIVVPDDLAGIRMRVPAGQMVADTFSALGAEPVTINSDGIYDALKTGRVDAQENPLALIDLFRIYEVVKYVSMTNHMWSGFNLLANLQAWSGLPDDVKAVIERNATKYVRLQRRDQERMNARLRTELARRGLTFNEVDAAPFRTRLSGFYGTWKERLGSRCWGLLEESAKLKG
jgi:TRAP-type transport system periplasmic protein